MPNVGRSTTGFFSGVCCCHDGCKSMTGTIIIGSSSCESGGLKDARVGDLVLGHCGHIGTVVTGSSSNKSDSLGKATLGSHITGCLQGTIVTGSPSHETGL